MSTEYSFLYYESPPLKSSVRHFGYSHSCVKIYFNIIYSMVLYGAETCDSGGRSETPGKF
jgi:hypothetical protein